MSDEWNLQRLLKALETRREECSVGLVAVDPTLGIVPLGAGALWIKPAIELQVTERSAFLFELLLYALQRFGVSEIGLGLVPIRSARVGPISKMIQDHIDVVCGSGLSVQAGQSPPPRIKSLVNTLPDH